jgi:hypothetical protein
MEWKSRILRSCCLSSSAERSAVGGSRRTSWTVMPRDCSTSLGTTETPASRCDLIYLSGIAGSRLSVLLFGSTISGEDHTARSRFSHELNPDKAKRILPECPIRQLIRHSALLLDPKLFQFIRGRHRVRYSGIYKKQRLERFLRIRQVRDLGGDLSQSHGLQGVPLASSDCNGDDLGYAFQFFLGIRNKDCLPRENLQLSHSPSSSS